MKQTKKILTSIHTLYDCCGELICDIETKKKLPKELLKELSSIKVLYMDHYDTALLIVYETLRLSQTKKK